MAPHAETPRETNGVDGVRVKSAQPNILYIMADQMAAPALKIHDPNSVIQTPNIDKLAETGVVFDKAYCNSPLCAPSRFTMLTGQLPSKIGGYDNASELRSDVPTFAHYLRREGYETTLAGKMHFIGPDQLHGWERRLTPDIYPGDFGWAVNWDEPDKRLDWYHNMSSVLQAGPCGTSNQLKYDEEVMHQSTRYLAEYVCEPPATRRPFFLTVSLTHPHDPYAITQDLWDQYEDVEIPLPKTTIPQEQQDPHSTRLLKCIDLYNNPMPEEAIKRARRAYYGACTYVDNHVGKLLKTLKNLGFDKNTIVIFSGDHGDMLGERGLWYKMSWFEMSARVPLIFNFPPRFPARRVQEAVSTMDLLPTLYEMVSGKQPDTRLAPLDGRSLYPALLGGKPHDEVFGEYMGEGTVSPVVMIRRGRYKFTTSLVDPPQLFDLEADPLEVRNVFCEPSYGGVARAFVDEAALKWDLRKTHDACVQSQRARKMVFESLKQGRFTSWDYTPPIVKQHVQSDADLEALEHRARYPPVDAMGRVITIKQLNGAALNGMRDSVVSQHASLT